MIFALWPPELISGLMYSGPGSGSLMAAAAAWDELASGLDATATSYQTVITDLTTGPWRGPSSMSVSTAVAPYVAWLHATAAQAEQAGAQAKAAAGAFETAFAATVPPPVIAANRALLAMVVATNALGHNTPAIAATEAHYAEMWAQDGAMLSTYLVSSLHTMMALPQPTSPPLVAAGMPGAQLLATTQSVATNTLGAMPPLTSKPFSSGINNLSQILDGFPGNLGSSGAMQAVNMASIPARFAMYPMSMLMQMARMGQQTTAGGLTGSQALMNSIGEFVDGKMQLVVGNVANQLRSWGSTITAQLGQAHSLGGLSVPQAWSSAAPVLSRTAPVLPQTSVSPPATSSAGMPAGPFGQALMGALSGRGVGSLASKVAPKVVPRSPAGG